MDKNTYVYFIYSNTYEKERNDIENKVGKVFVAGTVIVGGSRKEYSIMVDKLPTERYSDLRIIAEGKMDNFKFTPPTTRRKRGV